jgi:CheY-like chemotaxis protein
VRKLQVLVAEGHRDICRMLVSILITKFDVIMAVNNGEDLVKAAISLHPDVIVSDISMPQLTGPQAMQRLSAGGYSIPCVFVSPDPDLIEPDTRSCFDKMHGHSELVAAVEAVALGNATLHAASVHKDTQIRIVSDFTNGHPLNHVSLTYKLCAWILCFIFGGIVLGFTLWGILWFCRR